MSLDKRSIELGDGQWAVKEDKLFAFRRDRDKFFERSFDFSRASYATRVNSDGLIEYAGISNVELVTNGSFDQDSNWNYSATYWEISNGTANSLGAGNSQISQQLIGTVSGKYYLISISSIENISGGTGVFSVVLGTNTVIVNNYSTSINVVIQAPANDTSLYISPGSSSFNLDNVSVKEVQQDFARIDYSTGEPVLLLEPARTNLKPFSETTAAFSSLDKRNVSVQTRPGFYSFNSCGEVVLTNFVNDYSKINLDFNAVTGETNFFTFYIKPQPGWYLSIEAGNGSASSRAKVNLETGELLESAGSNTGIGTSELVYSDAIKIIFKVEANGTTPAGLVRLEFYDNEDLVNYNHSEGVIFKISGVQLENNVDYPTSYIPTYGTTVTRAAETANSSGNVGDFNDDEGVLYAELYADSDSIASTVALSDGTSSNAVRLGFSNTQINYTVYVSGFQANNTQTRTLSGFNRVAVKYKANDFALWVNGEELNTDLVGSLPADGTFNRISFDRGDNSVNPFYGKCKALKVYTEALNDAELRLLTKYAPKDYDVAFTADYVDTVAEINILRTEATDKLYYVISDGANEVSGSATITATEVTISNIDISSLSDGTLTVSVYIEDERQQRGVTVTDTTIKDTTNTPLYSYALQQRATGAVIEELDNAEAIIESLNVEV
jgi:hypothetical protein